MKSEQEIKDLIEKTTKRYRHVLDYGLASIDINAPRALIQLEGITILDTLYGILGEKRPQFAYDDRAKMNH